MADGAPAGLLPILGLTVVMAAVFRSVARGSLRALSVAPLVTGSQVLVHCSADLLRARSHHGGLGDALLCLLPDQRMLLAHGATVLLTVLALVLLKPLVELGTELLPTLLVGTPIPRQEWRTVNAAARGPFRPRRAFIVHGLRRGPAGLLVPM